MTHSLIAFKTLQELIRESFDNTPDTLIGYFKRLDLIVVAEDEGFEELAKELIRDNRELPCTTF